MTQLKTIDVANQVQIPSFLGVISTGNIIYSLAEATIGDICESWNVYVPIALLTLELEATETLIKSAAVAMATLNPLVS